MNTARPSRLLIVDDDLPTRALLSRQLEEEGYDLHEAPDGEAGLDAVRSLRPDLVLCDWAMPRLDGIGFCRSVKADPELRWTYVAMLTGKGESTDKVAGLDAGADDFLVKPIEHDELLARVRAGLRIRRSQRELSLARLSSGAQTVADTVGGEINNCLTALLGHMALVGQYLDREDPLQVRHHVRGASATAARIAHVTRKLTEPNQ